MQKRFNKTNVLDAIEHTMTNYEKVFGFKRGDGYVVVKGKGFDAIRSFGAYAALRDLHEQILEGDL